MKKVSSIVWQFFDRLEENNRCVAVLCKLCDTEYKYFGNTTNLRAHLVKKHPIQWECRQNNAEGTKILEVSSVRNIYEDQESTNQSTVLPRRCKMTRDANGEKNVRYSLFIQNPDSEETGEKTLPRIEIQRMDLLANEEEEEENDDEATRQLIHQMHNQGSDEDWLEEDYVEFEPKRKRVSYGKIKREIASPSRRCSSTFIPQSTPKPEKREYIFTDDARKDEYSVFGEYIANKLRKFKAPRTRGNIQQIITTILWQAEYGMFDDAESVKRVLCTVQNQEAAQTPIAVPVYQAEATHESDKEEEHNQSTDSVELGNLPTITS